MFATVLAACSDDEQETPKTHGEITLTIEITQEEKEIRLGLESLVENLLIDWGDGMTTETLTYEYDGATSGSAIHYYEPGTYTVKVSGEGIFSFGCNQCEVSELDVSKCPQLESLNCWNNKLTQLDVSQCTKLTGLYCYGNQLTELDVNQCQELEYLDCYGNQLTRLEIRCPKLNRLDCKDNQLTELDVTQCPELGGLYCENNQLTQLDVTQCPNLQDLYCEDNLLTELDVTKCVDITVLSCGGNQFDDNAMTAIYNGLPNAPSKPDFIDGEYYYHSKVYLHEGDPQGKTSILKNKDWGLII